MESPEQFIREELDSYFVVKPKSIGKPTQYLGNKVTEVTLDNGASATFSRKGRVYQNVQHHLGFVTTDLRLMYLLN